MAGQVIERDRLGVLTKIGQGGQGVVYQAPNVKTKFAASMVYKEYKPHTRAEIDFTALAAMPALVEDSLSYPQAERLVSLAAWPCALVDDNGIPTGFVMPAIPRQFFIALTTVKGSSTSAAEFQHLLNHPSVLQARGISVDDAQRYALLREVASGLAFIHRHGVCVGDISPKNLLFALSPHPAVYVIDCDAMRINGVSALRQVETPGWEVPAGEELATVYSDAYKLGLLALRLLVGDHDTTNPQHLPAATPDLLGQIITDTLTNPPQRRPGPEAWTYVLGHAIEAAQHQQKTATPAPAGPAIAPPPQPAARSRPSTPTPPSAPPTPPPTPQVRSRPSTPTRPETAPVSERVPINEGVRDISERLPESAPTPARKRPDKTTLLIGAIVILVIALALAIGIPALTKHPTASPPTAATAAKPAYGRQIVLPFTGLSEPTAIAVDNAGNVYVIDMYDTDNAPPLNAESRPPYRVLKLAAGSSAPEVLPFSLKGIDGLAVDAVGDVYVSDLHHVLKLRAGSPSEEVLFTSPDDQDIRDLAVDAAGNLYLGLDDYRGKTNCSDDRTANHVLKLRAGSSVPEVLPFTDLLCPKSIAVDSAGTVYVADDIDKRVAKLPAGSSRQEVVPFTGIACPMGVAVDAADAVYTSQPCDTRVWKLPAGSSRQELVPLTGTYSFGLAVDSAGNVYVADANHHRVVKLPAG